MRRRSPSKGRAQGVLALTVASAVASLCPARASADEARRVAIEIPVRTDALLEEAMVRVRGELFAMGLEADVRAADASAPARPSPDDLGGTLLVERDGPWIRIRAFGPASAAPAVQELYTRRADVTAEVVAVRAVEALRAVMTSLREPRRAQAPAPSAPRTVQEPPPPAAPPRSSALSLAPREGSALSVWLGPAWLYDAAPRRSALGAELGGFWGHAGWFGGVQLGTSLLRTKLDDPAGHVYVRRTSALARIGLTFQLSPSNELWFSLGSGLARYAVQGQAAPGYVSASGHHISLLLAGGAGVTSWFSSRLGAYLRLDTTLATDATAVQVTAREISVLERPALIAALGLSVRLR